MSGLPRVSAPDDRPTSLQPIEMTGDPRFAPRVMRLAGTSVVALGIIWFLAVATLRAEPTAINLALLGGWILMPATLGLSLRWPRARYAVVLPSALVSLALVAICLGFLPQNPLARLGWLLLTAGILFGGVLGVWFWFRFLPVPASLSSPFSAGRWTLIGAHVALIVLGAVLAGMPLLQGTP